jgi:cell division protease FtsH
MDEKNKKPGSPWSKSLLIWVGVLLGLVLFAQMLEGGSRAQTGNPIAYSDFIRQVGEGNVRQVTSSATPAGNQVISGKLANGEAFRHRAVGRAGHRAAACRRRAGTGQGS